MAYNIEQCIAAAIAATTTITGIVSTRYSPMMLPQNTDYPALSWRTISNTEQHNIDIGIDRIQFDCWAETYAEAKNLAGKVKARFQRAREDNVGGTSGLKIIQGVFVGAVDLFDEETEIYHIPVDMMFIYVKE